MNENEVSQNEQMEIDLVELLQVMKSKYKAIVLCVLIGAVIAGVITVFMMSPKYQSAARIYPKPQVSEGVVDGSQINANNLMVNNYVEMLKGNNIQHKVASNLGISSGEVSGSVSVSSVNNTQIIRISAKTTDPELSLQIVNEMIATFTQEVSETLNVTNIAVIDEAELPTAPVSPSLRRNIIIGAFAGGVICAGIIFLRYMLDTRIHNKEEAEKYLDIPCLGSVPYFD